MALNPSIDIEASVEARHRQNFAGMVKIEEDAERYRAVIAKVQPSLIVEVGTFSGKSALWFSQFAPVLTIDVNPIAEVEPETPPRWDESPHPIRQHVGRSAASEAYERVTASHAKHPGPVLVILDGDHSADNVVSELWAYADLAAYVVIEDTLLRHFPYDERVYEGDPMDALEYWLPNHPEWTHDEEIEFMHPITQFPRGWLKRTETP